MLTVNIKSCTIKEDLKFRYVHYPNHYGTFFAFSKSSRAELFLCSCNKKAINNYLIIDPVTDRRKNVNSSRMAPFNSYYFPDKISEASMLKSKNIKFEDGLCHRCNNIMPSKQYCVKMYGSEFVIHYGWYVNLTFLEYGIDPHNYRFVPNRCPEMFLTTLSVIEQYKKEIVEMQDDINFGERKEIFRLMEKQKKIIRNEIENITRSQFGYEKIGEKWTSETILYKIIKDLYPKEIVKHHFRPDYLDGLELDIFIPHLNLGVEYQGQQHYKPIQCWGGKEGFEKTKSRDRKKQRICNKIGLKLLVVKYDEPLEIKHIKEKILSILNM